MGYRDKSQSPVLPATEQEKSNITIPKSSPFQNLDYPRDSSQLLNFTIALP